MHVLLVPSHSARPVPLLLHGACRPAALPRVHRGFVHFQARQCISRLSPSIRALPAAPAAASTGVSSLLYPRHVGQQAPTSSTPSSSWRLHPLPPRALRSSHAYQFEVPSDDVSKPQTFQTEQAMLARYSHLLRESNLINNLKSRARFERPRDKAKRRRQERIEQRKWQHKQAAYVPESLESAGGPDMHLEEPFFDCFQMRASWDTARDHDEPTLEQEQAAQLAAQQQLNYGHYAFNPNNIIDIGSYMGSVTGGVTNIVSNSVTDMGGYLSQQPAGGYVIPAQSDGGYYSSAPASQGVGAAGFMDMDQLAAAAEGQYWQQQQGGQYLADHAAVAAGQTGLDSGQFWQQQQQQQQLVQQDEQQYMQQQLQQTYAAAAAAGQDWAAWATNTGGYAHSGTFSAAQQQLQQQQPDVWDAPAADPFAGWPTAAAAADVAQQGVEIVKHQEEHRQQQQQQQVQQQPCMADLALGGITDGSAWQQQVPWQQQQQQQGQQQPCMADLALGGITDGSAWQQQQQQQQREGGMAEQQPVAFAATADLNLQLEVQAVHASHEEAVHASHEEQQHQFAVLSEAEVPAGTAVDPAAGACSAAFEPLHAESAAAEVAAPPAAPPAVPPAAMHLLEQTWQVVESVPAVNALAWAATPENGTAPAPQQPAVVDGNAHIVPEHTGAAVDEEDEVATAAAAAAAGAATPVTAAEVLPSTSMPVEQPAKRAQQQPLSRRRQQPGMQPNKRVARPAAAAAAAPAGGELTAASAAAALREAQAAITVSMEKMQALDALLASRGFKVQQQPGASNSSSSSSSSAGAGAAAPAESEGPPANAAASTGGSRAESPGRFRRMRPSSSSSSRQSAGGRGGAAAAAAATARGGKVRQGKTAAAAGGGGQGLKGPIVLDEEAAAGAGGSEGAGSQQQHGKKKSTV